MWREDEELLVWVMEGPVDIASNIKPRSRTRRFVDICRCVIDAFWRSFTDLLVTAIRFLNDVR